MRSSALVLLCAAAALTPLPAAAQAVQGPAGGSTGIFGAGADSRTPTLAASFDFDGGYDNVTIPDTSTSSPDFVPVQRGYVASGAATLRLRQSSGQRYILGLATGSLTQQQIGRDLGSYRMVRAESSLEAGLPMGPRAGAVLSAATAVEPTYLFGAFDAVGRNDSGPSEVPPVNAPPSGAPVISITEQRWLANRAGAALHRNLTSRQTLRVRYDGMWVRPLTGTGFRSESHAGTVQHVWNPRQNFGLELLYRADTSPQFIEGIEWPLQSQTFEARTRFRRGLSSSRTLSFMAGGGVVQIRAQAVNTSASVDELAPTASGSMAYTLTRRWTLSVDGRRDVSVLTGLSAEPFRSTSATVSLNGVMGRRLSVGAFTGYSRGQSLRQDAGTFDVYSLNAQVVYGFTPAFGAILRYTYEDNSLVGATVSPSSLPAQFGRNAIRLGVTLWAPLYGRF